MILHFNVIGEQRKAMVKAIEEELGIKAKYLGVPGYAYQVGNYTIGKNGELEYPDETDHQDSERVSKACVKATGQNPAEWDNNSIDAEESQHSEDLGLTVAVPIENVNLTNLKRILEAKGALIRKSLGVDQLPIETDQQKVYFPWFTEGFESDHIKIYAKFITSLCSMSMNQKRVQAKEKEVDNQKYAFRCFLLRLGYIGDDKKADRKVLLKNFDGSASYKDRKKAEETV